MRTSARGIPGFSSNDIEQKMSLRLDHLGTALRQRAAAGFRPTGVGQGLSAPLSCLQEARFGILSYADWRVRFDRPISGRQLTQQKLADLAVSLNRAMRLALHLGRLKDAGRIWPEHVSVGKLNNVHDALDIVRLCRIILGANGSSLE